MRLISVSIRSVAFISMCFVSAAYVFLLSVIVPPPCLLYLSVLVTLYLLLILAVVTCLLLLLSQVSVMHMMSSFESSRNWFNSSILLTIDLAFAFPIVGRHVQRYFFLLYSLYLLFLEFFFTLVDSMWMLSDLSLFVMFGSLCGSYIMAVVLMLSIVLRSYLLGSGMLRWWVSEKRNRNIRGSYYLETKHRLYSYIYM